MDYNHTLIHHGLTNYLPNQNYQDRLPTSVLSRSHQSESSRQTLKRIDRPPINTSYHQPSPITLRSTRSDSTSSSEPGVEKSVPRKRRLSITASDLPPRRAHPYSRSHSGAHVFPIIPRVASSSPPLSEPSWQWPVTATSVPPQNQIDINTHNSRYDDPHSVLASYSMADQVNSERSYLSGTIPFTALLSMPPQTSTSSLKTTVTEEHTSRELPVSASDALKDLTNELRERSSYPVTSGGFGDIWKCVLVKPSETVQVAVKTIRAFESDNKALIRKNSKRVRRELKVWGRLKHDSILPLWGVANDFGPYPAMICPWADNGALTGFLERQQDILSYRDRFSLLNDIALGLQYLHKQSIVHGDLTGSNVLIYGDGRACLADFGLSTIIWEFIGTSYFTSSIKGNIRWAAAELFEVPEDDDDDEAASASLSIECDIYSFGSITLQVLTGKVPYYNVKKDNVVLGQVIRGKKPEPPKESRIEPAHWEFIKRCWLPRINRPSVEEAVTFVGYELMSSYIVF